MLINTLFLHYIQVGVSGPSYINVLQWNRDGFFFRHIELNSRFIVMTINEVTLYRSEVSSDFSVIFRFCRLRLFRFSFKSSTENFTPCGLIPLESGFLGIRSLSLTILLYHLLMGI